MAPAVFPWYQTTTEIGVSELSHGDTTSSAVVDHNDPASSHNLKRINEPRDQHPDRVKELV